MTATLEGGAWSAARPGRTLHAGKTQYPLYRRLDGPQGRSERVENLSQPGFDPRTAQPVVAIPSELPGPHKVYIIKDINPLFDLIYELHSITHARDPHPHLSRFIFDFSTQRFADQTTSIQLYLVRIITDNRVICVIQYIILFTNVLITSCTHVSFLSEW